MSGLTCDSVASVKGISLVSLVADTNRHMVPDPAVGIDATKTRARILTFSRDAGQLWGTVGVENTLRLTVGRRPDHVRQTGALTPGSGLPGDGRVRTTRVGKAGILSFYWLNG